MRELNYRPNAIARSMARRSTATIGLVVSEIDNPVHSAVIQGAAQELRDSGYNILLASAPTVADEIEAIETLRAQQVAGFIFMLYSLDHPSPHLSQLNQQMPMVVINRYLRDRTISQVGLDDGGAGFLATEHLLELGHTRIGILSGRLEPDVGPRSARKRHAGWQKALRERGIEPSPAWVIPGGYDAEISYQAMRAFLTTTMPREQLTALVAANFPMALAALKAVHEAGVRVPDELALVCIDDPPQAAYTYPALTTLSLPVAEAGRVAARVVLEWVKNGALPCAQHVSLGFTLHIRESCGG
jgi:LacI family transcriptional regulator